jgi:hypothetical protein
MKFCPQCGTTLIPGDRFCQECGFDLSAVESAEIQSPEGEITAPEPAEIPVCQQCGKKLVPGDRFCEECGFDTAIVKSHEPVIETMAATPLPPVPEPEPVPEETPPTEASLFCPQCGKPMITGDRFCQECGFDTLKPATTVQEPVRAEARPVYSAPPVVPPPVAASSQPHVKKKNKTLFWILLIAGLAVLCAGGWFGYNKFLKSPDDKVVVSDTTVHEEPVITVDTATIVVEEDTAAQPDETVTSPTENKPLVVDKKKEKQPAKIQPKQSAQPAKPVQTVTQPAPQEIKPVIKITPGESTSSANAQTIFFIGTKENPKNQNPKNPTKFTLNKEATITRIVTDHYNDGNGDASGGTIMLKDKSGSVIGQWKARPSANKSGVANAKWVSDMNVTLQPGTYYIHDSNPSTWSKNALGIGFVEVIGIEK